LEESNSTENELSIGGILTSTRACMMLLQAKLPVINLRYLETFAEYL